MRHKCICGIVLLVLSGAFLPNSATAYYSPRQGRWLSRDPIGEKGGVNVHGYAGNNPMCRSDRLGLEFVLYESGYEPVQGDIHGATSVKFFDYKATLGRCGCKLGSDPIPPSSKYHADCRQIYFEEVTTVVSMWWHDIPDRDHEERHVEYYRRMHDNLIDWIKFLAEKACMLESQAKCYYSTIGPKLIIEREEADLAGAILDDFTYGLDPKDLEKKAKLERQLSTHRAQFLVMVGRCDSMR